MHKCQLGLCYYLDTKAIMHKKTVEVVVKHFCTKLDLRQRNVFPQWFQRTRRTITTCKGAPVGPLSSRNKTEILNFGIVSAIIGHDLHIEYLHKNPVGMIRKQSKGLLTFSPRNKNSNLLNVPMYFCLALICFQIFFCYLIWSNIILWCRD